MHRPLILAVLCACTGSVEVDPDFATNSCDVDDTTCVQVRSDDVEGLLEAANRLTDDGTIVLGSGTFALDNGISLRAANQITFIGQGIDDTILDLSGVQAQVNGVDVIADGFTISDLTITDSPKDGLRVEDSSDVIIRRVKVTWSTGAVTENGGYGIYPVSSTRVLVEDSETYHASDAGLYIGQCQHAIIRNNIVKRNVAGLEIENTQFAEIYGNLSEDNTAGLLVFDLPGNPIVGRDISVHDNIVRDNNRPNFAPGGTVGAVPSGVGTFAMASRRVELFDNTYEDNNSFDIAIVSGLAIESDPTAWAIATSEMVGDTTGLVTDPLDADTVANFRSTEIWVHDNTHTGGGTAPDGEDPIAREIGFLLKVVYGDTLVDAVLYDSIGESAFDAIDPTGNSNDHHVCVSEAPSFASLDLEILGGRAAAFDFGTVDDLFRPSAPFAPFDCTSFTEGPLVAPDMGSLL
jgi:parallel beta-helix repeat protein